jgi:hypothetical protein
VVARWDGDPMTLDDHKLVTEVLAPERCDPPAKPEVCEDCGVEVTEATGYAHYYGRVDPDTGYTEEQVLCTECDARREAKAPNEDEEYERWRENQEADERAMQPWPEGI